MEAWGQGFYLVGGYAKGCAEYCITRSADGGEEKSSRYLLQSRLARRTPEHIKHILQRESENVETVGYLEAN